MDHLFSGTNLSVSSWRAGDKETLEHCGLGLNLYHIMNSFEENNPGFCIIEILGRHGNTLLLYYYFCVGTKL